MKKLFKSFSIYRKENIESPTTLFECKCIQIWRIRICWLTFVKDNCKFGYVVNQETNQSGTSEKPIDNLGVPDGTYSISFKSEVKDSRGFFDTHVKKMWKQLPYNFKPL